MSELVWKDPPAAKRTSRTAKTYEAFESQLREHEGQWARLYESAAPSNITHLKKFFGDGFEVTGRDYLYADNLQRCDIYARYIGNGSAS